MKRLAMVSMLAMLPLVPGAAWAGSSTDAALGLGAFAVFNQIISGTGIFGGLAARPVYVAPAPPVYVAPAPVYVAPQPVYVAPQPVYVAPRPVYVAPRPVYVSPRPVYVAPRPVVIYRGAAHGRHGGKHWNH